MGRRAEDTGSLSLAEEEVVLRWSSWRNTWDASQTEMLSQKPLEDENGFASLRTASARLNILPLEM